MLVLLHRWLGIVLCAFFALWFASGAFMLYVDFPRLTDSERLAGEGTLDFSHASLSPGDAAERLGRGARTEPWERIVAVTVMDRPAYVFDAGATPRVVFADDGSLLGVVSREQARDSATRFAVRSSLLPATAAALAPGALIDADQWTVSGEFDAHRPLFRFELGDTRDTQLYVSSATGAVVLDTQRRERILNGFAAITHWLYPFVLRRHAAAWTWTVEVLSGAGCLVAVCGLWLGVLRLRPRRSSGALARIPYRGAMRWHHIAGLVFGVTTLTWVASGLLSMEPGGVNDGSYPTRDERRALAGAELVSEAFELPPLRQPAAGVLEAELREQLGHPAYVLHPAAGPVQVRAGRSGDRLPSRTAVIDAARRLMPDATATSAMLERYDDYYYPHDVDARVLPLPVIRLQFEDAQRTWFYVDPLTSEIVRRCTRASRVYRWLYSGLHTWDFAWLRTRPSLRNMLQLALLAGGFALSALGTWIGWRRLRNRS